MLTKTCLCLRTMAPRLGAARQGWSPSPSKQARRCWLLGTTTACGGGPSRFARFLGGAGAPADGLHSTWPLPPSPPRDPIVATCLGYRSRPIITFVNTYDQHMHTPDRGSARCHYAWVDMQHGGACGRGGLLSLLDMVKRRETRKRARAADNTSLCRFAWSDGRA